MNNNDGAGSMVIGFFLAVGNHTWGWFNTILEVHFVNDWTQALLMGCVGSVGTFGTSRLLKYIEKKIKKNDKKD